jgi:hypothetical protein
MSYGEAANPYAFRMEETSGVFNPAKKSAAVAKYNLDRNPEVEVSAETARRQTEENLARSDIGPLMRSLCSLARELEDFEPEAKIKQNEYSKARQAVVLYDKTERRSREGLLNPAASPEDANNARWFASTSRAEVLEEMRVAKERSKEAHSMLSDVASQMQQLRESIEQIAIKNRITTTAKRGDVYYMVQRRTSGLVMPRCLPMEFIGHRFFKLFSVPEALAALDTEEVTPVLRDMFESTPVEHSNDRRLLQDALARLGTDKDWTRNQFLVFLQGTFSHELESEFRRAHQTLLMDDTRRFMLDLPMDKHRRNDAMLRLKRHPLQEQERVFLERKKFGMEIHDELRQTERDYNARLAKTRHTNPGVKPKYNAARRRGQGRPTVSGGNGPDKQTGSGNNQHQGGHKRTHPGNGAGGHGGNRPKKGPRAAYHKPDTKDSK